MAKSVEQLAAELADREAIHELPQRYCDCVWRGDVEGIVNLFSEDGEFTIIGNKRENKTVGRANLLKSYGEGLANLTPRPYIHNHVIEFKANGQASGRCYVELRNASGDGARSGDSLFELRNLARKSREVTYKMAKTIEQIVTELADRVAIRELPSKYCDCVWRNDVTGIVDLFAGDGAFITKGRKREHRAEGH